MDNKGFSVISVLLLVHYYLCIFIVLFPVPNANAVYLILAGLLTLSQFYCVLSSLIKVTRVKKAKDAAK